MYRNNLPGKAMGNWKLEVFKMTIYMAFPVGIFHYFNQPQYFEEALVKLKRELYPPQDSPEALAFRKAIKEIQLDQELEELKRMEGNL